MIVKTASLVLRRHPFGESSQTATLLTRELGRIQVLAKGIRRKRAAEQGGLDLLTLGHSVVYHKSPGALHLLAETAAFEQWRGLRQRLDRIHAGYLVAELALALSPPEAPMPELFGLWCRGLRALAGAARIRPLLDALVLRALTLTGDVPRLDGCAACSRPQAELRAPRFDYRAGGVVCERCARGGSLALSRGGLVLLSRLASGGVAPDRIRLSAAQASELGRVLTQTAARLLGRPLRMAPLLIDGPQTIRASRVDARLYSVGGDR